MKIEEAIALEEEAHQRRMKIRRSKAHDYAKENVDCLSNFKVMADVEAALKKHGYGIPIETPQGTAAWHLLHKFVRIINLWNDEKEPENETLVDNFDDLVNYANLAKECYIDYKREERHNTYKGGET